MCFNRKVLAWLAAAAVGVFLVAPQAFGRALPILILAACPLSMVVMMRTMRRRSGGAHREGTHNQSNNPSGEATTQSEVDRLRREIAELRAELNSGSGEAGFSSTTRQPGDAAGADRH